MDLLEVANKRSIPGILIFNHLQEPIFFNPVALAILSKVNGVPSPAAEEAFGRVHIPKEISNLYESIKKSYLSALESPSDSTPPQTALFASQDSTYCCRGFPLEGEPGTSKDSFHIMMLMEKVSQHRQIDIEKLKKRFQLTIRQMEIIKHLFAGCTNRQIAETLCVSEDTIKGHLKHIMRRLKVNSRTEILSMILQL